MRVYGHRYASEPEHQAEKFQQPVRPALELPDQDLEEGDVQERSGRYGSGHRVANGFRGVGWFPVGGRVVGWREELVVLLCFYNQSCLKCFRVFFCLKVLNEIK